MYIGFSSPSLALPAISDDLNRVVQPILATVEGVASADVIGGQTFAMRIWLDPVRMAARGVSAAEVSAAIRANNYQTAPGQQKGYFTIANITTNTDLQSVDAFREMVMKVSEGGLIRLRDIATVRSMRKVSTPAFRWTPRTRSLLAFSQRRAAIP